MNVKTMKQKRDAGENGFTLIELLVVVVIIGILTAIAIPVYLNYKKGASDKSAESDVRNAVAVLEQCNTDNTGYPTTLKAGAAPVTTYTPTPCTGQTVKVSPGTTLAYVPSSTSTPPTGYILMGYNSNGSGSTTNYYCYASTTGGSVVSRVTAISTKYSATGCPAK